MTHSALDDRFDEEEKLQAAYEQTLEEEEYELNQYIRSKNLMTQEAQKLFTIAVEDPENEAQVAVARECQEMARFLIEKNKAYGNSVLEPLRIFSSSPSNEQIKVRIDDKLSRLQSQALFGGDDEDTLKDLIGYLIYLKIARRTSDA